MPSILIVGATGNTGGGVIQHLSSVLPASPKFKDYRLIGLTRSTAGSTAQRLSKLPHVEMIEQDWTLIKPDWLRSHGVERVFVASHNGPTHFTDESLFFNYALEAEVKYVVRISTTQCNVGPATPVYYGRNHWAVEKMLEQPEFAGMGWTSLQPNVFSAQFIPSAQAWLKAYREKGQKTPFKYMLDGDTGTAVVDPVEVGIIAGHLLALEDRDTAKHSGKRYIVVGPADSTGKEVVALLEKHAGTKVEDVTFRDVSWLEDARQGGMAENVLESLGKAPAGSYDGGCSIKVTPTTPEVLELYAPKNSFLDQLEEALEEV